MDEAKTSEQKALFSRLFLERAATETVVPLNRQRLEVFYKDGPEAVDLVMQYRDLLAMAQHKSSEPIKVMEFLQSLLGNPSLMPDSK